MAIDSWLPVGFSLPGGSTLKAPVEAGAHWQIFLCGQGSRALVSDEVLTEKWQSLGLIAVHDDDTFSFGGMRYWCLVSTDEQSLCSVNEAASPDSKPEALSFAVALRSTREIDRESPLQDALYVEKISRLLPTYEISSRTEDEVVLGQWLTGGAKIPAGSFRRLNQAMSWLGSEQLMEVVEAAGISVDRSVEADLVDKRAEVQSNKNDEQRDSKGPSAGLGSGALFELAGRPELAGFFNEHIIEILQNRDRYAALGIGFPSAVVLHGPPGCGKTFAVERLIDFLEWPSFQIDASSVASPYIHETSRKVAEVFEKAIDSSPSVLVIDEMEAFLTDREMGSGHHRVEEVAEFLRRIPEAAQNEVLIIAMTNRIDMIDPAIMRRGRFDHVIQVDFASEVEVRSLLDSLLSSLPKDIDVDPSPFAAELAGRPLSDVAFVVREGARLAARSGKDRLDQQSLNAALASSPAREREGTKRQPIGFIR